MTIRLHNPAEANASKALDEVTRTMTLGVMAHRLSPVSTCDTIHLSHRGRLEASGTYDQLVKKNSRFREIVDQTKSATPASG